MKPTNQILATLFLMAILFIPSISALPRDAELNIDFVYPQPSGNITYQNNTFINQTINATVNTTQFDSNNPIEIKTSWLTSFIQAIVESYDYLTSELDPIWSSQKTNYYNKTSNINAQNYNITASYINDVNWNNKTYTENSVDWEIII